MNEALQQATKDGKFMIALPCEPENFSKFLGGLLGKPQTIEKAYSGSFSIAHNDIENVYHLVKQRVNQQNDSSLIKFNVQLLFDDNSTVLLDSLEDFKSFTEVKPLVVTQVNLSWSFIVQFKDRENPERQNIELSFRTKMSGNIAVFSSDDSPILPLSRVFGSAGTVSFRIEHTARSWGADMEALLSSHIKHILLPESSFRQFIRKHSGKIAVFLSLSLFIFSIAACFYSADHISTSNLNELKPLLGASVGLHEKVDKLLELSTSGYWGKFFFSVFIFTIFSLIVSIIIGVWAETSADTRKPSYILLTKKSEQFKEEADNKYKMKLYSFILSIVVGVATGIVSNMIFTTYWS
ncbi:hypothetical protein [Vibrio breoganii]|uniref:hypothetical protein n=1 Tax=Vibrio breoganii TaxID=553239 RepID=UPI000C817259|nr:hypothetical protein [Vibrio breoganii]PML92983.1 hypothetical protein BCT64_14830 [Vibrio breoganii]PMN61613.1 hypothetical protein BCT28_11495 [Vibrio breoganii]